MTSQQWEEVKERFHEALREPTEFRQAFLIRSCSSDAVRLEVERLLAAHASADTFLSRPVTVTASAFLGTSLNVDEEFTDTSRFAVQERLGSGSFGIVYRVFDKQRNSMVALKKARHFDSANLLRFKKEFRSLVDLAHPNLVHLYELFGDGDQWFFTMELVQGVDFVSYVRPGNLSVHWERLRSALFQFATGIRALHASGQLHRDLKPSNVLVTYEGRVVILDFGLVKEFAAPAVDQSLALAGSPAYMAPEQAAGGSISEAADWYAAGVMLFKALTGQLPFTGTWNQILERKKKHDPPRSRDLAPDIPKDLDDACHYLLQRRPEIRAKGAEILLAQGSQSTTTPEQMQEKFVGRLRERNLLRNRFAALSSGKCQVVLLGGRSGIGKTSLVSHFLGGLVRENRNAVILSGRCRESEAVPYKAIDPIIDQLVRHLGSLPEGAAMAALPRRPELLKRLFPVFGELEVLSGLPDRQFPDLDEQEIRRRAFEALCELLGRLADRNPIVISIDDLQWGDLDSIEFLADLILSTNAPALMLLLSFRSEEAGSSPPMLALRILRTRSRDADSWLDIDLDGLSEDEGRDLLDMLQPEAGPIDEGQTREILRESGGSPLLLRELLRFASYEMGRGEKSDGETAALFSEMIRHRASKLSATARQLLEVLSVAGEPVSKALLYHAAKVSGEDPARETDRLVRERLVRITTSSGGAGFETFHDQVREASLAWLSPAELRRWHSELARLLAAEPDPDPQRLLRHHRGAGNLPAAFETAVAAAGISETALAFEQAARFYAEAIKTGQADQASQATLHRKHAEALAKAGRGYESAQSYLNAALSPACNDHTDVRRLAAEQLIRTGYMEEGTRLFADLLRRAGIHVPATRRESLLRMLVLRVFIRVRGLHWRERAESSIAAGTLRRLDLLWSGAMALVSIDTIFGSYLQALHMLAALRAGEPARLALSLGFAAVYECMGGSHEYAHGRKLISRSQQLSARLNDPYLAAMSYGCWAGLDFLSGRVKDGLAHCRTAVAGLNAARHRSRAWELGTFNMLLVWFLGWGGRIQELSETLPVLTDEGRSRGDVYTQVMLRCSGASHLVELALDRPEYAMAEIARNMEQWRKTSYDLPHLNATFANAECLLYAGRAEAARHLLVSEWELIQGSLFLRKSQIHRTILSYLRGRVALAEWFRRFFPRRLRHEIEEWAVRLVRLRSPWGEPLSYVLRSGIMAGLDRSFEAVALLQQAEAIFREQDLDLLAAAALRRSGELQGKAGIDRVNAADSFMSSEKVLRPDRMASMILGGPWLASQGS
jgi:serine/threonine protein kinase